MQILRKELPKRFQPKHANHKISYSKIYKKKISKMFCKYHNKMRYGIKDTKVGALMMDTGYSGLNKKCLPWSWAVEHLVPS